MKHSRLLIFRISSPTRKFRCIGACVTVSQSTVSQSTISQSTVSQSTISQSTISQSTVSQSTVSFRFVSQSTVSPKKMHRRGDTKRLLLETAQNTTSRLVYAWIRRHIAHVHMYTNMTETALICFRKIWTDLTVNRFPRSRWSLQNVCNSGRENPDF